MTFAAYQARHDGTDFTPEGRDEAAGILGIFRPGEAPPVVTAHTFEELERDAKAHLGQEPDSFLYLTDGTGRVLRIMINEKHRAATQEAERRTVISICLLVFSTTCLVGASLGSLGSWALLCFVVTVVLYALLLRLDLETEIEAAVLCEILLIITLLLTLLLPRLRSIARRRGAAVDFGTLRRDILTGGRTITKIAVSGCLRYGFARTFFGDNHEGNSFGGVGTRVLWLSKRAGPSRNLEMRIQNR